MIGQWVKTADFDAACDAAIAVEQAVGVALIDTINEICTNDAQKGMAQVIATAVLLEKLDASKTELGAMFGESVDIVLAMLKKLPVEADGTRNLALLATHPEGVH